MKLSILICIWLLNILVYVHAKMLTIHIVPHSHNDAGWLMSFEGYYKEKTNRILTNVINVLIKDPKKIFHWSDVAFFHRWWQDQTEQHKIEVKKLVSDKQFIFIGGGWVMNDEALPSYKESMLQMRLGLDFLKETFGIRPNIGWQIDPFGHSAVTVSVQHKLGYEVLIGNRISNNLKDKMRNEVGYNFIWEGHQVDKDKSEDFILAHILQFFYVLPQVRFDNEFLYSNLDYYRRVFFDKEIDPVVDEINKLSGNNLTEYHVMIPVGDDFGFVLAEQVFNKVDSLISQLVVEGNSRGFITVAKYSSIIEYFKSLKSLNITFGNFNGDFLPYQEPFYGWDDFWSGYYSTRLHLKRSVRHVYNQIQSAKTLLVIRAIEKNNNSINFRNDTASIIDSINTIIKKAEEKWSVLMHHDGITGTHTSITESSYYTMLHEASNLIEEAYDNINKKLSTKFGTENIKPYAKIINNLNISDIIYLTVVNPTGYKRTEIVNITLPHDINLNESYTCFIQNSKGDKINTYVESLYFADLQELDLKNKEPKYIRKGFIKLEVEALSDAQIYVLISNSQSDMCNHPEVKCASKINPQVVNSSKELKNNYIKVNFDEKGNMIKFENLIHNISSDLIECFTYYISNFGSRSGLYLFNPRSNKETFQSISQSSLFYEDQGFIQILQVYQKGQSIHTLKTYIVYKDGDSQLQNQLFLEVQTSSTSFFELNYSLKLGAKSVNSDFRAYTDDSLKMVQRPINNGKSKFEVKFTNQNELNGFFTFPCVHGGMLRETFGSISGASEDYFFGWSNSNPIGCTFSGDNQVDIMVYRSIGGNDNKGVDERFQDSHVTSTSFQFYFESSVDNALKQKEHANSRINEPLFAFYRNFTFAQNNTLPEDDICKGSTEFCNYGIMHQSGYLISSLFSLSGYSNQLSSRFGEVDIVDVKLMRHKLIDKFDDYEVVLVLRNRYNEYIQINKTVSNPVEGIFKNKYIDVLMPKNKDSFKCDPNK